MPLLSPIVSTTDTVTGFKTVTITNPNTIVTAGMATESFTTVATSALSAKFILNGDLYFLGDAGVSTTPFYKLDRYTDIITEMTSLPVAINKAAGFELCGYGFVAGGIGVDLLAKSDMYKYDPTSNSWTTSTPMPYALYGAGSASIAHVGYVGCGYNGSSYPGVVMSYNFRTSTWTTLATNINLLKRMNVAAVIHNGDLAFVGGMNYLGATDGRIVSFNTNTNISISGAYMPTAMYLENMMAVSIGGYLYVGGGATNTAMYRSTSTTGFTLYASVYLPSAKPFGFMVVMNGEAIVLGGTNTTVYSFAPPIIFAGSAGRWTGMTPFGLSKNGPAAGAAHGRGFVFGGSDNTDAYVYNPITNSLSNTTSMPVGRTLATCVSDGRYLYVIGGMLGSTKQSSIYRFDPYYSSWTTLTSYSSTLFNNMAFYLNGYIYVFGGQIAGANSLYMIRYDISSNTWLYDTNYKLPGITSDGSAFVLNGKGYMVSSSNLGTTKTYEYNPYTNTWSIVNSIFNIPNASNAACSLSGYGYVINNEFVHTSNAPSAYNSKKTFVFNPRTYEWIVSDIDNRIELSQTSIYDKGSKSCFALNECLFNVNISSYYSSATEYIMMLNPYKSDITGVGMSIYYTDDGRDPVTSSGGVGSTAKKYSSSFYLKLPGVLRCGIVYKK